jgi:hypothetical protein
MTDTEFIDFMKELVLSPDSVIKKEYMGRMLKIHFTEVDKWKAVFSVIYEKNKSMSRFLERLKVQKEGV